MMPLMLVDDRDGRVLAQVDTQEEALRLLEAMAADDANQPSYLCLVVCDSSQGAFVETDSSVKIRTLL